MNIIDKYLMDIKKEELLMQALPIQELKAINKSEDLRKILCSKKELYNYDKPIQMADVIVQYLNSISNYGVIRAAFSLTKSFRNKIYNAISDLITSYFIKNSIDALSYSDEVKIHDTVNNAISKISNAWYFGRKTSIIEIIVYCGSIFKQCNMLFDYTDLISVIKQSKLFSCSDTSNSYYHWACINYAIKEDANAMANVLSFFIKYEIDCSFIFNDKDLINANDLLGSLDACSLISIAKDCNFDNKCYTVMKSIIKHASYHANGIITKYARFIAAETEDELNAYKLFDYFETNGFDFSEIFYNIEYVSFENNEIVRKGKEAVALVYYIRSILRNSHVNNLDDMLPDGTGDIIFDDSSVRASTSKMSFSIGTTPADFEFRVNHKFKLPIELFIPIVINTYSKEANANDECVTDVLNSILKEYDDNELNKISYYVCRSFGKFLNKDFDYTKKIYKNVFESSKVNSAEREFINDAIIYDKDELKDFIKYVCMECGVETGIDYLHLEYKNNNISNLFGYSINIKSDILKQLIGDDKALFVKCVLCSISECNYAGISLNRIISIFSDDNEKIKIIKMIVGDACKAQCEITVKDYADFMSYLSVMKITVRSNNIGNIKDMITAVIIKDNGSCDMLDLKRLKDYTWHAGILKYIAGYEFNQEDVCEKDYFKYLRLYNPFDISRDASIYDISKDDFAKMVVLYCTDENKYKTTISQIHKSMTYEFCCSIRKYSIILYNKLMKEVNIE